MTKRKFICTWAKTFSIDKKTREKMYWSQNARITLPSALLVMLTKISPVNLSVLLLASAVTSSLHSCTTWIVDLVSGNFYCENTLDSV